MILLALVVAMSTPGFAQMLEPEQVSLARAGIAARESGDLQAAESALDELAKQVPWFLPVHLNLGLVQYELFKYSEAAHSFRQAITLDEGVEGVRGLLGHSLLEIGRLGEATGTLEQALERDPNDVKLRFWLARALVELGRMREAQTQIEVLQGVADKDPELLRLRILVSGQRSADLRRQLMQLAPSSVAAKITAAETLTAANEWSAAVEAYESALTMEPRRRGVRLALGDLLLAQGDHDRAETLFREESALGPYAAEPLLRLGDVLLLKGDSAGAERVLSQSLELDEESPASLELLARSQSDQGRYQDALETLLKAATHVTDLGRRVRIQYQLAQIYRRMGNSRDSTRHEVEFLRLQKGRSSRAVESGGKP